MRYILYTIFFLTCLSSAYSESPIMFTEDLHKYLEKEIEGFEFISNFPHEDACVYEYCRGRIDAYKEVLLFLEVKGD